MSVVDEITNSVIESMLLEAGVTVGGEPYKCWYCSHTEGLKCCFCGVKGGPPKHLPRGVVEENMAMMKVVHGAIAKKKIDGIVAAEVEKQCRIRDAAKERQKEIDMSAEQYMYMIVFWNGDRWEPSSVAFATLKRATDSLSKAIAAKPLAPHEIVCITAPPSPEKPEGVEP